jgi:hypothetical protein
MVLFVRLSKQRGGFSVGATVVTGFRFQPSGVPCKPQGGLFLAFRVNISQNLEGSIAFSLGDGLLGFFPTSCLRIVRHDLA